MLIDHFVGLQQDAIRKGHAERLCSLPIQYEVKFGRLLDRKVARIGALQDLVDVIRIYADPGLSLAYGDNRFSLNVPIAVERNIQKSGTMVPGGGGMADYVVVASYSRRF